MALLKALLDLIISMVCSQSSSDYHLVYKVTGAGN